MSGEYTLLEPDRTRGGNVPITSVAGMNIHHPGDNAEAVRRNDPSLADDPAAIINGELETIRPTGEGREPLIKKDMIFQDSTGNGNVSVPSPVEGYAHYLNPNDYGGVRIYNPKFGEPGAQLVGQVLHMDDRTFTKREGEFIQFGEPLGIQSGTGPDGRSDYGVHAHIEVTHANMERYVNAILRGEITQDTYPALNNPQPVPAPPVSGNPSQNISGTAIPTAADQPQPQLNQLDDKARVLYQQIDKQLTEKLPPDTFKNEQERTNAALALTAQAYGKLNQVTDVGVKDGLLAVSDGKLGDPASKGTHMKLEDAVKQTPEDSLRQIVQRQNEVQLEPRPSQVTQPVETQQQRHGVQQ